MGLTDGKRLPFSRKTGSHWRTECIFEGHDTGRIAAKLVEDGLIKLITQSNACLPESICLLMTHIL